MGHTWLLGPSLPKPELSSLSMLLANILSVAACTFSTFKPKLHSVDLHRDWIFVDLEVDCFTFVFTSSPWLRGVGEGEGGQRDSHRF